MQAPDLAFADPELQDATPDLTVLGLPRAITGAFAAIFPVTVRERRWAVKCFLTDVKDQKERYKAISQHLSQADLQHTLPFEYQERGIQVDGSWYPILKMKWVEGRTLRNFVAHHLESKPVLEKLSEAWVRMLADLKAVNVAHGDLQHGNVLVQQSKEGVQLQLVDYDTMWVPALQGRNSTEVGHRNYQHPDRSTADFGPHLDHFSGLVIYTALEALRLDPDLWHRYDTGENLLFTASDFYHPDKSALFEELAGMEALTDLADALRTACYIEPEKVAHLTEVDQQKAGAAGRALAGRVRRSLNELMQAEVTSATDRSTFQRYTMPVALLGVITSGALAWMYSWVGGAALFLLLCSLLLAMAVVNYRRLPVVRRRRRLEQELAYFDQLLTTYEEEVRSLEEKRAEIRASIDERREDRLQELQEEALYDKMKYHFIHQAEQVEGITHKTVVRLKAAGVRTAHDLKEKDLRNMYGVGEKSRARLLMWKSSLEQRYADDVPDDLSPAEERRFNRMIRKRIEHIDEEIDRLREKREVQQEERAAVADRLRESGRYSFASYLLYLLRTGDRPPALRGAPSAPAPRAEPSGDGEVQESGDVEVLPDGPWWKQGRA